MTREYRVTYRGIEAVLDCNDQDALFQLSGEPESLSRIVEICTRFRVTAELRDESGFRRGLVGDNGDWCVY